MIVVALFGGLRVAAQSAMPDVVCVGAYKHYWVDPTSGSTYTWQIDGVTQQSTTNEIYITWDGAFGTAGSPHTVSVQERSAAGCYGEVKSGLVYVNPPLPLSVTVSASQNPACGGNPVTFTATAINGGTAPVYSWKVNGSPVGATAATYTYQPASGDQVACEVTSNAVCVTNSPAVSVPVTMQVASAPVVSFTPCFDVITSVEAQPFRLKGGLPLGGTYSGLGVNSVTGMFDPAVSGPGNIPVKYVYTNVSNCKDSAAQEVHVYPAPAFSCGGSWTDIRDGKSYPTIKIGTQCWLAANLDHGTQINSPLQQSDNCTNEKYCYGNDAANCAAYGGLYQWDELMKYEDTSAGQGICPAGWHVPAEPEWQALLTYYNGSAFAGLSLQDPSGFNALTGGVLYQNSSWSHKGLAVLFWTSTTTTPVKVMSHGMNDRDKSVSDYESLKNNAFPVRCIKN